MKLFSSTTPRSVSPTTERPADASRVSPQPSDVKARRPLTKDTVMFAGTTKHKDLYTTDIISTPDGQDLKVKRSNLIGGLNSGGKIWADDVAVSGAVDAKGDIEYRSSDAGSIITSREGNIFADHSDRIGGLRAHKGNIKTYELAVQGDVFADQGNVKFISSDTDGQIHAGGTAKVEQSKNINGIHAGGKITTRDILAKKDVVSDNGDIDFIDSDVKGTLKTSSGDIKVDDSDSIGGIDSAGTVFVKDAKDVKRTIHSGGDVTLRSNKTQTLVHDIEVHSGKSEASNLVDIGAGVTVDGNINFENGLGTVVLAKGARLLGETNGDIQSEEKNKEKDGSEKQGFYKLGGKGSKTGSSSTIKGYPTNDSTLTLTQPPGYYAAGGHANRSSDTVNTMNTLHDVQRRNPRNRRGSNETIDTIMPTYGDNGNTWEMNPETGHRGKFTKKEE